MNNINGLQTVDTKVKSLLEGALTSDVEPLVAQRYLGPGVPPDARELGAHKPL